MNDLANAHLPPILFHGPDECTRPLVTTKPGGIPLHATGLVFEP